MAHIFRKEDITFELKNSPVPEYAWHTSRNLTGLVQSKHLNYNIRKLDPGKYSYPYHFHRNAEELFMILSGNAMLRTPDGFEELHQGDTVFFEMGPTGAHQLYNHSNSVCEYLDIRTETGIDVCEYPDTGKVNVLPEGILFERKDEVDYFKGEDKVKDMWPLSF
jgi:uncharacterized cupin superfamily protein